MKLSGDANIVDMPLKDSEVNHLRQLLAWMRVEYTLDEDMQRGYLQGAHESVALGLASAELASEIVNQKAAEINKVPAYVRQAHKMLTKALKKHEAASGVISSDVTNNQTKIA
jgi:hypothetical protein